MHRPQEFSMIGTPHWINNHEITFSLQELNQTESKIMQISVKANATPAVVIQNGKMNRFPFACNQRLYYVSDQTGIENLREKSEKLTAFLEFIIDEVNKEKGTIRILTPRDKDQRGCQLSLVFSENGKQIHEQLLKAGIITDWRNPDVIRLAPAPLYNSFEDVWKFGNELQRIINA